MSQIRFYIVTDDPVTAMLYLFGLRPSQWPSFIAVLDDPIAIADIPDGAKCRGMMFSGRNRSLAEIAWRDRRGRGGIGFMDEADGERIFDWIDRRDAALRPEPVVTPVARPEPELQNMTLSQRWT